MVINRKIEEDKERFKWAVLTALHHEDADSHPERILKLRRFQGHYDCGGLTFSVALDKISIFEQKNDVSVNILVGKRSSTFSEKPSLITEGEWPICSRREEALCHDQEPE